VAVRVNLPANRLCVVRVFSRLLSTDHEAYNATTSDRSAADATYRAAVQRWPKAVITLRQVPAITKERRVYKPRIVGGKVMMPADLKRLHKYMLDIERIDHISDEMRGRKQVAGAGTQVAAEEVAGLMLSVEQKLFDRACSGSELPHRALPIGKQPVARQRHCARIDLQLEPFDV
jgi:hypothetical protein